MNTKANFGRCHISENAIDLQANKPLSLKLMKIFAIILSMSIFSMALVPCADGAVEYHEQESSVVDDGHEHNEDDDCTPFCSCDCCSVTVTVPQIPILPLAEVEQNYSFSFLYSFSYSFDYAQGVWRPPNFSC